MHLSLDVQLRNGLVFPETRRRWHLNRVGVGVLQLTDPRIDVGLVTKKKKKNVETLSHVGRSGWWTETEAAKKVGGDIGEGVDTRDRDGVALSLTSS